jgi:hypothetical protein
MASLQWWTPSLLFSLECGLSLELAVKMLMLGSQPSGFEAESNPSMPLLTCSSSSKVVWPHARRMLYVARLACHHAPQGRRSIRALPGITRDTHNRDPRDSVRSERFPGEAHLSSGLTGPAVVQLCGAGFKRACRPILASALMGGSFQVNKNALKGTAAGEAAHARVFSFVR